MRRSSRRSAPGSGFTLVEVLLALVIIVIVVAFVCGGFGAGARASLSAQRTTRAVWLAQTKMADLESGETAVNIGSSGDFSPDHPEYAYAVETEFSEEIGLYEVCVTVTWEERGRERSYALTRLLYRPQS